ncbi:MAG: hypothetical protein P4M00_10570 [Azospirillaceae bacterium]|nr:hypothetical protein [Azospirillaceae bacterium]
MLQTWLRGCEPPSEVDDYEIPFCRGPEDFTSESAREAIRLYLARFLEPRRLTPLELIHLPNVVGQLTTAGEMLAGAIQRAAAIQVHGTEESPHQRARELMDLVHSAGAKLEVECGRFAEPVIQPHNFLTTLRSLETKFGTVGFSFHALRGISRYLTGCQSWQEKLERVARLCDVNLEVIHISLIDRLMAEIVQMGPCLRELANGRSDVGTQALMLAEMHGCRWFGRLRPPLADLACFDRLMIANLMPRTRWALRKALIRVLTMRSLLRPEDDLLSELEALAALKRTIIQASPILARDDAVRMAIEVRTENVMTAERIETLLYAIRRIDIRLERFARLIDLAPSEPVRARVRAHFSGLIVGASISEVVQSHMRRIDAVSTLVRCWMRLASFESSDNVAVALMDQIDAAIVELVRSDILGVRGKSLAERLALLITVVDPLPEAPRFRALVADVSSRAIRSPKLIEAFGGRFAAGDEREAALVTLHRMAERAEDLGALPAVGAG